MPIGIYVPIEAARSIGHPNQFLSIDQQTIQCAFHGALFEIDSGLCVIRAL